jgi:hypothetical protein
MGVAPRPVRLRSPTVSVIAAPSPSSFAATETLASPPFGLQSTPASTASLAQPRRRSQRRAREAPRSPRAPRRRTRARRSAGARARSPACSVEDSPGRSDRGRP